MQIYQINFYVPASHLEQVKMALFTAGAGRYKNYDQCCWQVLGEGQYRPLDGAQPHKGTVLECERAQEYRVEMICKENCLKAALSALVASHPYEEPAYFVTALAAPVLE